MRLTTSRVSNAHVPERVFLRLNILYQTTIIVYVTLCCVDPYESRESKAIMLPTLLLLDARPLVLPCGRKHHMAQPRLCF